MKHDGHEPDFDEVTGVSTTGHSWDGITELNNPLPRWWLWTFYATIIWSVGYWIVYPAWPLVTSYTQGVFEWRSRTAVVEELEGLKTLRGAMTAKLARTPIEAVSADADLMTFTRALGRVAFADNCAGCHGSGGGGAKGFANLNDDDWIWGGKLGDISTTIAHGVRWVSDENSRIGAMPALGRTGVLNGKQIGDAADFVRSLAGLPVEAGADLAAGRKVFAEICASCHGEEAKGNPETGAPNLVDAVWLYGSDRKIIMEGMREGRGGIMPAWSGRLDETTIKALTVYVHSMGGGE
jgi:cytochrome c oxidase cbb3-type subunit 3